MTIFMIEDEAHAEWQGDFATYEAAFEELKRRADIPWDAKPNQCPCTNWKNCGRRYEIIEFDNSKGTPWEESSRISILEISSAGIKWNVDSEMTHS